MTKGTVLVVHGVANRSGRGFGNSVEQLGKAVGISGLQWAPVFWGDLAPIPKDLLSVPTHADDPRQEINELVDDEVGVSGVAPRAPTKEVTARTRELIHEETGEHPSPAVMDAVKNAIQAAATDNRVRPEVAPVLAAIVAEWPPEGSAQIEESLSDRFTDVLARVARSVDMQVGKAVGQMLQDVLRGTEAGLDKVVAKTAGDVLAYEANGALIRGRLDTAFEASQGSTPVHVVAHSLGSLVTAEWLLGGKVVLPDEKREPTPLSKRKIGTFVSFGSQVSLFAELHGLLGQSGRPKNLDPPQPYTGQLERWVNIWHQFDPLAFVMHRVLQPTSFDIDDRRLQLNHAPRSALEIATAHTSYWENADFIEQLHEVLTSPG